MWEKEKRKGKPKPQTKRWTLALAVVLLVVATVAPWTLGPKQWDYEADDINHIENYPALIIKYSDHTEYIPYVIVAIFCSYMYLIYIRKEQSGCYNAIIIALMVLMIPTVFCSLFLYGFRNARSLNHIQSTLYKQKTYHVAHVEDCDWEFGCYDSMIQYDSMILYECDEQGIVCENIHREFKSMSDNTNFDRTQLMVSPDGENLYMQIGDEVVYSLGPIPPLPLLRPITPSNVSQLSIVQEFVHGNTESVAWSPTEAKLAVSTDKGINLYTFDVQETILSSHIVEDHINDLHFSQDGTALRLHHYDNIQLLNITNENLFSESSLSLPRLLEFEFGWRVDNPSGTLIFSNRIRSLLINMPNLERIVFDSKGLLLAVITSHAHPRESIITVFDVDNAKLLLKLEFEDGDEVTKVAFHPQTDIVAVSIYGYQRVTSGLFQEIQLWDISDQYKLMTIPMANDLDYMSELVFNPDGTLLIGWTGKAYPNASGTLFIWDTHTGKLVFSKDTKWINDLAFKRDGTILATVGGNGVQLWGIMAEGE